MQTTNLDHNLECRYAKCTFYPGRCWITFIYGVHNDKNKFPSQPAMMNITLKSRLKRIGIEVVVLEHRYFFGNVSVPGHGWWWSCRIHAYFSILLQVEGSWKKLRYLDLSRLTTPCSHFTCRAGLLARLNLFSRHRIEERTWQLLSGLAGTAKVISHPYTPFLSKSEEMK